jgi:hypothetical protein
VLKAREDIVVHLKERAQDRLAELGKPGQEYETLLQQLILQVHCPFQEPAIPYLRFPTCATHYLSHLKSPLKQMTHCAAFGIADH